MQVSVIDAQINIGIFPRNFECYGTAFFIFVILNFVIKVNICRYSYCFSLNYQFSRK